MSRSERSKDNKEKSKSLAARAGREIVDDLSFAGRYVAGHVVGIKPTIIKSFARLSDWTRRTIKLLIPLAVLLFFTFVPLGIEPVIAQYALGIFLFIALMWTMESLPLPVTSLIVPVLLVIYGIFGDRSVYPDPARAAFAPFATPVIYLVLGGIIISVAFRKTHLDARFAYYLVSKSKGHFENLLLAIMLACGLLSMWISNTATAALLIPVAIGIAGRAGTNKEESDQYAIALLLGIGASAAIGGMATIVGTSANAVSAQFITEAVGPERFGFVSWMIAGLPLAILLLFLSWYIIVKMYPVSREEIDISWVKDELDAMGKISSGEKKVLAILGGTIVFWIVGEELANLFLPPQLFPGAFANAAIVSMIAAILLFVTRTLDWEDARLIPWGIFLIIGAGLALGQGLEVAGFNGWLSGGIEAIAGPLAQALLGVFFFLLLIAFVVIVMSNFVNNTATVAFFVPLMIALSGSLFIDEAGEVIVEYVLLFSMSVGLVAAVAFMTPVAHPPSTLIYGTGIVSKKDMFKSGFAITVPSVIIAVMWVHIITTLGWI
jgi:sodium-dependent dicarboxylate transporter 2/3/5